jgi:hypothetical protein
LAKVDNITFASIPEPTLTVADPTFVKIDVSVAVAVAASKIP